MWCRYNAVTFLLNHQKRHPVMASYQKRHLAMARYGVSFVYSNPDLYSASIVAVMYVVSCYSGPRNHGIWLYLGKLWRVYFKSICRSGCGISGDCSIVILVQCMFANDTNRRQHWHIWIMEIIFTDMANFEILYIILIVAYFELKIKFVYLYNAVYIPCLLSLVMIHFPTFWTKIMD